MAFLQAKDIALIDALNEPLRGAKNKTQGRFNKSVDRISGEAEASRLGRGAVKSEYIPAEISQARQTGNLGIQDALYSALGDASLNEYKKQKEYEMNVQLAEKIGSLNKGNSLQEILGALGQAGSAAGKIKGMFPSNRSSGAGMEYANYSGPRSSYTSKLNLLEGGY